MISKNHSSSNCQQIREGLTFFPRLSAETISKLQHYYEGMEGNEVTIEIALPFLLQYQEKLQEQLPVPLQPSHHTASQCNPFFVL